MNNINNTYIATGNVCKYLHDVFLTEIRIGTLSLDFLLSPYRLYCTCDEVHTNEALKYRSEDSFLEIDEIITFLNECDVHMRVNVIAEFDRLCCEFKRYHEHYHKWEIKLLEIDWVSASPDCVEIINKNAVKSRLVENALIVAGVNMGDVDNPLTDCIITETSMSQYFNWRKSVSHTKSSIELPRCQWILGKIIHYISIALEQLPNEVQLLIFKMLHVSEHDLFQYNNAYKNTGKHRIPPKHKSIVNISPKRPRIISLSDDDEISPSDDENSPFSDDDGDCTDYEF